MPSAPPPPPTHPPAFAPLPAAPSPGANVTWQQFLTVNLIPTTLGNIVAGTVRWAAWGAVRGFPRLCASRVLRACHVSPPLLAALIASFPVRLQPPPLPPAHPDSPPTEVCP
jgi:hypothetical protein